MRYAAWDSFMATPDEHGSTPRDHLTQAARGARRDPVALARITAQLTPPPIPEPLEYFWTDRFLVLHGMRGQSMSGLAPFTPEMIFAADRLFEWHLTPREVHALRMLDVAVRHPEAFTETEDADDGR